MQDICETSLFVPLTVLKLADGAGGGAAASCEGCCVSAAVGSVVVPSCFFFSSQAARVSVMASTRAAVSFAIGRLTLPVRCLFIVLSSF